MSELRLKELCTMEKTLRGDAKSIQEWIDTNNEIIKLDNRDTNALCRLANYYKKIESNYSLALKYFNKVIEILPDNDMARRNINELGEKLKTFGEAPNKYSEALILENGIYHLGDYYSRTKFPYRHDSDFHTTHIISVKQARVEGITYFSEILNGIIEDGTVVCVVPSSKPDNIDTGIRKIAKILAAKSRMDGTNCLIRKIEIQPSHYLGSDRSVNVHLNSIICDNRQQIYDKNVVLLDDVKTSGNSLKACAQILIKAGAKGVQCIALGRTVK